MNGEKQSSSGNQSTNTNEVEPLEGIGTGPVSTTDEPETQIRTGEGRKQTDKENHSSAEDEFNAWLSLLLSFVIVCFTGVLACVAWKQFRIAREAHCVMHRPKLRVRNVFVPDLDALIGDGPKSAMPSEYDVVNVGRTKANLTACDSRIIITNNLGLHHLRLDILEKQVEKKIGIAGGETCRMKIPDPKPLNKEVLARFTVPTGPDFPYPGNNLDAYVIGFLKYRDAIGLVRQTAFCRKFNRATERFDPVDDPDYEYED